MCFLLKEYYLEALEIQAQLRSIPAEANNRAEPWWLPSDIWTEILAYLSPFGVLVGVFSGLMV
jgi:hypothetical protein